MGALDWIFLIIAVLIIIITLIQGGKSEGASGAITGGGMNVFAKTKERGVDRVLSIITYVLVAIFFLFALLIKVL